MASIRRSVRACDICGSENDVVRIRLQIGEDRRSGDVCARHRKSVESLYGKLPNPARGIAAVPVMDEKEWERERRTARRAPRRGPDAPQSAS